MKRCLLVLLAGFLTISAASAENRIKFEALLNIQETYKFDGEKYIVEDAKVLLEGSKVVAGAFQDGQLLKLADQTEETVNNFNANQNTSSHDTIIEVTGRKSIQFSGADLGLLSEVPFSQSLQLNDMKRTLGGSKIKHLTIGSEVYKGLYGGVMSGMDFGLSLLAAGLTGFSQGELQAKNEGVKVSDYSCSTTKADRETLKCNFQLSYGFDLEIRQ